MCCMLFRYDRVASEKASGSVGHMETVRQLTAQNEAVTKSLMEQMRQMQEEHRRTVDVLHQQLEQRSRQAEMLAHLDARRDEHGGTDGEPRPEERQDGEGMENVDTQLVKAKAAAPLTSTPNVSAVGLASGGNASGNFMSFEQLLNAPADSTMTSKMVASLSDVSELQERVESAEKNAAHVTELLNESEATVLHLTEQARVLKEEIRRLERNQEREASVSNMEYLKNVIMKVRCCGYRYSN